MSADDVGALPEGDDTVEQPLAIARKGGRIRRLFLRIAGLLITWLGLSVAVLFWQPGRFWQLGVGVVVIAASLVFPKKLHRKLACLLLACAMFLGVFYLPSQTLSNEIEFGIRSAGREADKGVYLVHTDYGAKAVDDPGETFRNADSPLFWKVNASDWDGVLKGLEGKRVRAQVIGIRFADHSIYPNIIWVEAMRGEAPDMPASGSTLGREPTSP
jgi:hypothetical protein